MARVYFGEGSWYDDQNAGDRFYSAKDIEYSRAGSVSEFYGFNENNIQDWITRYTGAGNTNQKEREQMISNVNAYASQFNDPRYASLMNFVNTGQTDANFNAQFGIDSLDYAFRAMGQKHQNKEPWGGGFGAIMNKVVKYAPYVAAAFVNPTTAVALAAGSSVIRGESVGDAAKKAATVYAISSGSASLKSNQNPAPMTTPSSKPAIAGTPSSAPVYRAGTTTAGTTKAIASGSAKLAAGASTGSRIMSGLRTAGDLAQFGATGYTLYSAIKGDKGPTGLTGQQISQAVTQGIQRAAPPAGVTVDATGTPASPSLDSPQVTAQIQNAALAQRMRASEALGLDSTIQTGPRGLKTRAPRRRKMLLGA